MRARLPAGHAALLEFVAAASTRRMPSARRHLRAARRAGVSARRAEEAALMLMLYAGYPAALNALEALRVVWPPRRAAAASPRLDARARRARGLALCRRVYGPVFPALVARVAALHPDLAVWMVEEGYGRVLTRPGLSALERELLTVAALAALGWEPQLVSHLLGAQRLGATPAQRARPLRVGLRCARDAGARAAAQRAWGRVEA